MEFSSKKNSIVYQYKTDNYIKGNLLTIALNDDYAVRADLYVKMINNIRICGQVRAYNGEPVKGVLVLLQKCILTEGKMKSIQIQFTKTDRNGYYHFDLFDQGDASFLVTIGRTKIINGKIFYEPVDCVAFQDQFEEVTSLPDKSYIKLVKLKGDFRMENEGCNVECKKDECEYLKGNLSEFEVKENDCEIRVDLIVKEVHHVRVWGRVTTCDGRPVDEALIKLVKVICQEEKNVLIGVAHTITDCQGFYQFDICEKKEKAEYLVIAGKAAKGKDRVIYDQVCDD